VSSRGKIDKGKKPDIQGCLVVFRKMNRLFATTGASKFARGRKPVLYTRKVAAI